MATVIDKRMSAELDGSFVVFIIGMRINKSTYLINPGQYEAIYSGPGNATRKIYCARPKMVRETVC